VKFCPFFKFFLYDANCPFLPKLLPALFLKKLLIDIPALLKSWKKHYTSVQSADGKDPYGP
jgi:hypothetical protein